MSRFEMLRGGLQLQVFRSAALPIWLSLGAVLAGTLAASLRFGVPPHQLMGDPATVAGWPFYLGLVSNLGAVLWAATATIFLFSFCVHRALRGGVEWGRFLLCSGLFVGLLGIDDFFLLHEQVFPKYLSIDQSLVVSAYAALAALYLLRFAPLLARTAFPVFVAALGLLGVSATLDQLKDLHLIGFLGSGFVEDGAKLFGIGTWLAYAIHTSATLLIEGGRAPARDSIKKPDLRAARSGQVAGGRGAAAGVVRS